MSLSKITGVFTGISSSVALYSFKRVNAEDEKKEKRLCFFCRMEHIKTVRDLPFYDKDEDLDLEYDKKKEVPLMTKATEVRKKLSGVVSFLSGFKDCIVHHYETGVAHRLDNYEENKITHILGVCSGALVGLLAARKRGTFKKLIYTSTGSGLVFSALHPTLAKKYVSIGWEHTKSHSFDALEKCRDYQEKCEEVKSAVRKWFDKHREVETIIDNIIIPTPNPTPAPTPQMCEDLYEKTLQQVDEDSSKLKEWIEKNEKVSSSAIENDSVAKEDIISEDM